MTNALHIPAAQPLAPEAQGPTICIGEILAEIVATTVGNGFEQALPLIGPYPSGAPAIFIDQCGRIGGSAAMIGAVGRDSFGQLNVSRLKRDGVDVSAVRIDEILPTGTAFVRYRHDDERDFVFNMWTSAAGALAWTPEVEAVVARAGHLHVMGTLLVQDSIWQLIERAATIIKARGGGPSRSTPICGASLSPTQKQMHAWKKLLPYLIFFCRRGMSYSSRQG